MAYIMKVLFLFGTFQFWDRFHKPFLCALIYAPIIPLFCIWEQVIPVRGYSKVFLLIAVEFPIVLLYFNLLERFQDSENWWPILAIGGIVLFLDFAWIPYLVH